MTVYRPIASLAKSITEFGTVLLSPDSDRVAAYVILEDDIVAMLETAPDGRGWMLTPVPEDYRPILRSRFPDRRLSFADDPPGRIWPKRPRLPFQHVDPKRINLVYAGDDQDKLHRRRGQTLDGDWDLQTLTQPFTETPLYKICEARFIHGRDWKSIDDVYSLAANGIAPKGLEELYAQIKSEKITRQNNSPSEPKSDTIVVGIARSGRYILLSGAERVAIARLMGLASVPANVVVRHKEWERLRGRVLKFAGSHRGRIYQRLAHPDLRDIQASHDADRLPMIRCALEGYDAAGKCLVDVGAHWGEMSAAMEDLGFKVTAVEANANSARMARDLRDATEHQFEIWEGSIFEFPRIEEQNVILGLNIFHHFLKHEGAYNGLVAMLQRSNADMVIFAAHVHDRGHDFDKAFRNYPPEEFARFVSVNSRLPNIALLGKTHDGRSLYKIHR